MIRRIKDYLYDSSVNIQDRLFILLTIIALFGMVMATVVGAATGENAASTISLIVAFFFMSAVSYFGAKMKKVREVANFVAVILVYILFPIVFFTSGGIHGGTPIWFIFAILYVGMIINGKMRVVLLISEICLFVTCYYVEFTHPEYVIPHSEEEFFSDSLSSLIMVGVIVSLLMGFQIYMFRRENEITLKQKEEIDALNKAQNRFFSSMSHEIRTPINTIIGLNEMILREDVSDEVAEDAENIQAASRMLLSLINDILDMSKFQSGQMQIVPSKYNTIDMISDVVTMMRLRAQEKGLEFRANIAKDIPSGLIGDEIRLKQILINVLNNAVKYTGEGYVMLSVQCEKIDEDSVTLVYSVSDSGMGIKRENIPYLFTAFKRVDEEKNKYIEGTGLGLSIVKQLVDIMGGKVTVNSVYTQGSTFIIEIPQKVADRSPIGSPEILMRHGGERALVYSSSFEAPKARVLIVDDTAANLMVATKLLRDTKVMIDTAGSGEEALQKTLNNEYHVIFMDHVMPEMDGIECMHLIRTQTGGLSRDARISVLTANAGADVKEMYRKEGFDGYVIKPVSGKTLEYELQRLLPDELVSLDTTEEQVLEDSTAWIRGDSKKLNVIITVPSVVDLPKELVERYHIGIIPMKINTDNGSFRDGVDIDAEAVLSYIGNKNGNARIQGIEHNEYVSFFADRLQHANNIIHLAASTRVTDSSYLDAQEVARAFDNVTVFDSGHISTGLGIMAIEACRMAENGSSPEEIIQKLTEMKKKVHTSFIVDNLDALVKSNQINNRLIIGITKAFMIHPVMAMRRGKMKLAGIYLGTREHARKRYILSMVGRLKKADRSVLYITHVGLERRELEWIKNEVLKRVSFDKVYITRASASISVNVGTGTFGLLYRPKDE